MTEKSLLSIESLRLEDPAGRRILDGFDFELEPGEFRALVGESGSGKSMAARAILQLLPPGIRLVSGRILFEGRDVGRLPSQELRGLRGPGIGMVFQEPATALNPAMRVGDQIAEGIVLHENPGGKALRARVVEMLERVGIPDPSLRAGQWPHEFSGGMRQRIMLAATMALRPRLLIADEPTTALDSLTQAEVMALMTDLTRERGTAVLLISHDLGLVSRYASRVCVLESGKKVEEGLTAQVLHKPTKEYTRRLANAVPRPKTPRSTRLNSDPVIAAKEIVLHYDRRGWFRPKPGPRVLDHVSISIVPGEVVALVGGSGSGKSTLGRALLRLAKVSAGQIMFRGENLTRASGRALVSLRSATQLIHQDPFDALDPRMTILEIVAESLRREKINKAAQLTRAAETLERVGLTGFTSRYPHELSGGQRQRCAIARAIVRRPAFVVADEPVSALDMTVQRQVMELLGELQREDGFACLFISHDFGAVMEIADRIVVLNDGRVVEEGPASTVFSEPADTYTRRLIEAAPGFAKYSSASLQ